MASLSISALLAFVKGDITFYSDPSLALQRLPAVPINVDGKMGIHGTELITTADEVLPLGDIGTIGYIYLRNLSPALVSAPAAPIITNVVIPTPETPDVVNVGAAGAATASYKVQAVMSNGDLSPASSAGTTTTSNATLDGTNFNRISWDAVPGAASYNIYRTAHPTTPSTNGLIASGVTALTLDDTGLAGDGTTAPTFTNAATWSYKIVAWGPGNDPYSVASAAGSTSTGRTILSPNNYNLIKWRPVEGAEFYDIYRTVSGGTPDETGLFFGVSPGSELLVDPADGLTYETHTDTGVEGDGTSPPSTTPWDRQLIVGPDGSSYPLRLKGTEPFVGRWNAAAIHVKATVNPALLHYLLVEA